MKDIITRGVISQVVEFKNYKAIKARSGAPRALLQVPVAGGEQVHVRVQEA